MLLPLFGPPKKKQNCCHTKLLSYFVILLYVVSRGAVEIQGLEVVVQRTAQLSARDQQRRQGQNETREAHVVCHIGGEDAVEGTRRLKRLRVAILGADGGSYMFIKLFLKDSMGWWLMNWPCFEGLNVLDVGRRSKLSGMQTVDFSWEQGYRHLWTWMIWLNTKSTFEDECLKFGNIGLVCEFDWRSGMQHQPPQILCIA